MPPPRSKSPGRSETRERILAVAAQLLDDDGLGALTTRAVAQAAGVQAPAIYRLFGDKDGLVDAVAEFVMARYAGEKVLVPPTDDPVADLRAAWDRTIDFGLANPALYAILANPERAARSPATAAGRQILRARVHRVAAAGRLRVPESRAVDLITASGLGAVLTLLAAPAQERDPRLADALFEAVMDSVLADARPDVPDRVKSAAVTLRAAADELTALTPGERAVLAEWLDRVTGS